MEPEILLLRSQSPILFHTTVSFRLPRSFRRI